MVSRPTTDLNCSMSRSISHPFQNHIWTTMEKDPLFSQPMETPSLDKYREMNFLRCKRLFEYDFIDDQRVFENPLRHKIFTDSLGMYDWSLSAKYQLNMEMTGGTITASGSPRHGEIVQKIQSFDVSWYYKLCEINYISFLF